MVNRYFCQLFLLLAGTIFYPEEKRMKAIVSVLVESPFYFTLPLLDRYGLVRRLVRKEGEIDLSSYQNKVKAYLVGPPAAVKVPVLLIKGSVLPQAAGSPGNGL